MELRKIKDIEEIFHRYAPKINTYCISKLITIESFKSCVRLEF